MRESALAVEICVSGSSGHLLTTVAGRDADVVVVDLSWCPRSTRVGRDDGPAVIRPIVVLVSRSDPAAAAAQCEHAECIHVSLDCDQKSFIDAIGSAGRAVAEHVPALRGAPLSPRERQILIAWAHAQSRDDVARRLNLSASTVRTYIERIRGKYLVLGRPACDKAALVARAIEDGILHPRNLRSDDRGGRHGPATPCTQAELVPDVTNVPSPFTVRVIIGRRDDVQRNPGPPAQFEICLLNDEVIRAAGAVADIRSTLTTPGTKNESTWKNSA